MSAASLGTDTSSDAIGVLQCAQDALIESKREATLVQTDATGANLRPEVRLSHATAAWNLLTARPQMGCGAGLDPLAALHLGATLHFGAKNLVAGGSYWPGPSSPNWAKEHLGNQMSIKA
jgi:hypothetical protein